MRRLWKQYNPEIGFSVLSLLIGGLGGLITAFGMPAYELIDKPWFTPPQWVFPVVWTILYILMGIGMGRVWRLDSANLPNCLWAFIGQLTMNLFWTVWFFALQMFGFSFFWLMGLLLAVLAMTLCFSHTDALAAKLQIPYLMWLVLASLLNYYVWRLNP